MLIFKPKTNVELGGKFESDPSALGYIAYDEEDNICGFVAFHLNGYSMEIYEISVDDGDAETYEGLIRSALNYGGNRNVYIAYYSAGNAVSVAKTLGFEEKEDKLYGEIPFLLQGHCCKGC
ncbi:MAG: hypothetical protein MJ147_05205 [Clostridia bacterium]|nr:hypothetical protein [Clostridia bacterium]